VSIKSRAEPPRDRFGSRVVIASPRRSFTAQPALVLQHVVAELVRENMREHESSQGRAGPCDDAFTISDRARGAQT